MWRIFGIIGSLFVFVALSKAQTLQSLLLNHFEQQAQKVQSTRTIPLKMSQNPVKIPFQLLLWVYQRYITHQLATNCPYHPTCSEFAKQAIQEFGSVKGVFLAADRLTRCNGITVRNSKDKRLPSGKIDDPPSNYRLKP